MNRAPSQRRSFQTPTRRQLGRASVLAIGLLVAASDRALAIDSVETRAGITVTGEITRWDESGVAIRDLQGKSFEFPADDIRIVHASLTPNHRRGNEALDAEDYAEAVRTFDLALAEERRPWAVSRLKAGLVTALHRANQFERCGEEFLALAASRNDPDVMALAPLLWIPGDKVPESARDLARGWMVNSPDPIARLLACSWLLDSSESEAAAKMLERLQTDGDPRVHWLARAQSWRQQRAKASAEDVQRFADLIEKMPVTLRGGPQYLLGLTYSERRSPSDAALALLWVGLVYEAEPRLRIDALFRAAQASEQAGFRRDAERLFAQIARDYPRLGRGEQASKELTRLRNSAATAAPGP